MDIGLGYLRDMIKSLFIAIFTVLKRAFFSSDLPTVHPHKKKPLQSKAYFAKCFVLLRS